MEDELLTVPEVANELAISANGVYALLRRGRLPFEAKSAHGKRVRRSVLEAYQHSINQPTVQRGYMDTLAEFTLATDMSPAEFEREWMAREIESTPENTRLWGLAQVLLDWIASEREARSASGKAVAALGLSSAK